MATFKIGKVVLKSMFKKPATKITADQPIITKNWKARTRGHIDIDKDQCILCGMCMRKCPANAITVDRVGSTWEIQRMQCIQCGSCTVACPAKRPLMQTFKQAKAEIQEKKKREGGGQK
jgi:formate hydrogenlyase subunit 6/NADH:ubiquinone oxidoreductase subunit I